MKLLAAVFACASIFVAGAATADQAENLIKKSGCLACHAVDSKKIGPSFLQIATKYRGDAGAMPMLLEKVRKGGSGAWGKVMMPPNPALADADLQMMIGYILATK